MDKLVVRLLSIELNGFKNVEYGKIEMPNAFVKDYSIDHSEILGIYGQNGSGKTAVIDSLNFLKILLIGKSLPKNAVDYISKITKSTLCTFSFYVEDDNKRLIVNYQFSIDVDENNSPRITTEKISFSKFDENKWHRETTLMDYNLNNESTVFTPKFRYDKLVSAKKENEVKLNVAKIVAIKECKSFIFSDEAIDIFSNYLNDEFVSIILELRFFAITNLFVINNGHCGAISLDVALPFFFKHEHYGNYAIGDFVVSLSEPTILNNEAYNIFKSVIEEMDIVIKSLIPGLSLVIKEYGPQVTEEGKEGIRFEVLSVRGDANIPIKYESEGIKKILSILNIIIAMYNCPSICIAVDELDAGVYEYLLGELLAVIEESGRGQLIFTSHNLRPLEMINKNSLVFTTTNPKKRYIHLTNVKSNNNLRDLYLRAINLGGQKEQIYSPTKEYEIRRALRQAGRDSNG